MKRINAIMILSLVAIGFSLLFSLLSIVLYLNLFGKLNTFMKEQIKVNESLIGSMKSGQDIQKQIMDVIKEYEERNYE